MGKGLRVQVTASVLANPPFVQMCTSAARIHHALTIAKLPGSDLAAIQFLDRSFEELGIIEAETGAQDGNLLGRLPVEVAAYMLKPCPARRSLRRGFFCWCGSGRCDLGLADTHFFKESFRSDF